MGLWVRVIVTIVGTAQERIVGRAGDRLTVTVTITGTVNRAGSHC